MLSLFSEQLGRVFCNRGSLITLGINSKYHGTNVPCAKEGRGYNDLEELGNYHTDWRSEVRNVEKVRNVQK